MMRAGAGGADMTRERAQPQPPRNIDDLSQHRARTETDHQREEKRQLLSELIQEIRVALPGVQILFAFLLEEVFADRFTKLPASGRTAYVLALLLAAAASILLIAPTAFHRVQHGKTDIGDLIR